MAVSSTVPRRPRRGLSYLMRRERDGRPQWSFSSSYAKCHGHDLFQHDGDLGESTDRDGVNGGAYVWARLCSHAAATTCSNFLPSPQSTQFVCVSRPYDPS